MLRIAEEALTFDDVLLLPGYSEVVATQVSLRTRLTRGIELNIPLVSAAMDTVTESRLAIALAQEGGIGIIHKSMSIAEQAEQVRKVKKFEAGVIRDPITVGPQTSIREVLAITSSHNISGVPVVDGGKLVGIVTSRDLRFETKLDDPVRNIMTREERLVTVKEGAPDDEVLHLLHKHRIEKVLVVNEAFELRGLITVKDIQKSRDNPEAAKDSSERLLVGAAPVSVAKSTMSSGSSSDAAASASHKIKRPSASVFPISTLSPLRVSMTSSGRKELPETEFSTAGTSTRSRMWSFASMIACASPRACAAPPMSFFIKSMPALGLRSSPPESKQTPLPTSVTFGAFTGPQCRSMSRGALTLALPTACTIG